MKAIVLATSLAALLAALTIPFTLQSRDQTPPALDDFRNSAAAPFGSMTVNVDVEENDAPTEPGEASVFYSTDAQASWTELLLTEIAGAGGTWEATFPVEDGDVHYYFVVHDDTAAAFSGPSNAGNAFPPGANLMVDPGDEPVGDAIAPENNSLDLDGTRLGYSSTHLYATLSNVTGSWPTSGGLFGPWFVYTAVIDNPDAGSGSIGFAMVYADVPLLLQTGLYVVDTSDATYTRIANVDHTIQGGDLHLRCNLADLYAHPEFGPDNPSGYYTMGAGTGSVSFPDIANARDMTNIYAFYRRTDVASVGVNTAPVLADPGWEIAAARDDLVSLHVTYTDADGHLPVTRNVVLDGVPTAMTSGPDHDYAAGVTFTLDTMLTPEDHTYFFVFSDGVDTVETEVDTIRLGTGVPDDLIADGAVIREIWPQPCRGEATLSFALPAREAGRVDIYDVRGRHVRALWSGHGGEHTISWNGRDGDGAPVASGIYFCDLTTGAGSDRARIVLVR